MRVRFLPYSMTSQSVKHLAQLLKIRRIKREGSAFRPEPGDLIVNWGLKYIPEGYGECQWLNRPINEYRNKLAFYQACEEFVPPFTTDKAKAINLIEQKKVSVVCRTVLNGHSGEGIVIADKPEDVVDAPVYCKYIKKMQEFRIHFFDREVGFVQQKKRILDFENPNFRIRSHSNGFVFAHNGDIDVPEAVQNLVADYLYTCPLDFGAIDIIYNKKRDRAYILEVNMSPGLEGTTLDIYEEQLQRLVEEFRG